MKTIRNSIEFDAYTWDDPGEYPNAVAGYALPSYQVCDSAGELVIEAEDDEELQSFNDIEDWFDDWTSGCSDCPVTRPKYFDITWNFQQNGRQMTITVEKAEPWSEEEIKYDFYDG